MPLLKSILSDALHLFYPHTCKGCGSDIIADNNFLCLNCINNLPETGFASQRNNPIEKYFWGRISVAAAHSEFYFTKASLIQQLMHALKYKGCKAIGLCLGELLGKSLADSQRFNDIDALIPLPLYADKEHKRGYNQTAIICEGISAVSNMPVITANVARQRFTQTQTLKHRTERWENVAGSFIVKNPQTLQGKHLLLVDDVITTGATLEACGNAILQVENTRLSIATVACTR